jgi:ferredoxin
VKSILRLTVNGKPREDAVAENALLIDYLREALGLTGTKQGCDGGECGACTVLVDGQPRLACSTLAHSVPAARSRPSRVSPRATSRACSAPSTNNWAPSAASARRA